LLVYDVQLDVYVLSILLLVVHDLTISHIMHLIVDVVLLLLLLTDRRWTKVFHI